MLTFRAECGSAIGDPELTLTETFTHPVWIDVAFERLRRDGNRRTVEKRMTESIRGSCLCGAVRFELAHRPIALAFCHCTRCRKAQGGPFGAHFLVRGRDLRLLAGADRIRTFVPSAPWKHARSFCEICGASLGELADLKARYIPLAAATLDDDPGTRLTLHEHVRSKAPWFEITDSAPQFPEDPPLDAFK